MPLLNLRPGMRAPHVFRRSAVAAFIDILATQVVRFLLRQIVLLSKICCFIAVEKTERASLSACQVRAHGNP
jgi:hypothetical protein